MACTDEYIYLTLHSLFSLVHRLSFLSERSESLQSVLGWNHLRVARLLECQARLERHLQPLIDSCLRHLDTHRSIRDDFFCERNRLNHGRVSSLVLGHRTVDEPNRNGLFSLQDLGRVHQLFGLGRADYARQPLRASRPRYDRQFGLHQTHLRGVGRHAHVAGEGHLEPAAERSPVDGGDDGHRQVGDGRHEATELRDERPDLFRRHLRSLFEVCPGAEHARVLAADDYGSGGFVEFDLRNGRFHHPDEVLSQRIASLRAVDRQLYNPFRLSRMPANDQLVRIRRHRSNS
mmetsp:Transcript_15915/g.28547  ORF Transcript_15915/g.28547 Transcript_15915/m.28547 type:complete len:290 (-) Transcript_15915:82-951(-)